ncbi:type VI secretion protein, partial [Streptomyces sp. NPDC041003]
MHDARRTESPARGGGIPDGLLVGLLAFLLGLAVLVWTATGLAAVFAKGTWPDTVTFTRTPEAVRALITEPHDIAAAWPDTDPTALSGWGLFWGLFVSQLLVLFVLTVFAIGVIARTKSRHARAKQAAPPALEAQAYAATPAAPNPAPPAFEAREPGGSAPSGPPAAATPAQPPTPASPAFEARGPGGSAPSNGAAPS